jgi:serine/threonine protein kinase
VLGSGGFGAVYKGMYRGEEVAIKKLHPMDGMITQLQMEEFKKEVANLQALRHERLVRFIGAAFVKPSLCLVLEFMANGSLYDLLHQRRQQLTNVQRLNMALQIAEGVGFLHGRTPPFVHRDLKSLNVVLDMALNVKLCDFGLTQSMEATHISRKDNEGGSPRYMAPELFDSKGRITEKVDVWALGCLAVEVFTGRVPHEECNTIQQVMIKTLVNKQLPFLDWTGVHPEIRNLAELCFVFDPRARIDAARFMEGLRGLHGL